MEKSGGGIFAGKVWWFFSLCKSRQVYSACELATQLIGGVCSVG